MLTVFSDAGFTLTSARFDLGTVVLTLGTGVDRRVDGACRRPGVPGRGTLAGAAAPPGARWPSSVPGRTAPASAPRCCARSSTAGSPVSVVAVHPRAPASSRACRPTRRSCDVPDAIDLVVICVPAAAGRSTCSGRRRRRGPGRGHRVVRLRRAGRRGRPDPARHRRARPRPRHPGGRTRTAWGCCCNDPDVRLNATFHDAVPPAGGLAVASQSGGVGIVLMDLARELGLGVHTFVSLGNKADVSSNDLLAAWYDDPDVTAAALYLESFGNAAKFARFARRFAERKPLLAVVGGRSAGGSRAGASHTAAAATPGRRGRRPVRPGRRDRVPRRRGPGPHRDAARRAAAARAAAGSRSSPTPAAWACSRPTRPPTQGLDVPEFSPGAPAAAGGARARHHRHHQPGRRRRRGLARPARPPCSTPCSARARWTRCSWSRSPPGSPTAARRWPSWPGCGPTIPTLPVLGRPARRAAGSAARRAPDHLYRTTASALRALGRAVRYAEWLAEQSAPTAAPRPTRTLVAAARHGPASCSADVPTARG